MMVMVMERQWVPRGAPISFNCDNIIHVFRCFYFYKTQYYYIRYRARRGKFYNFFFPVCVQFAHFGIGTFLFIRAVK